MTARKIKATPTRISSIIIHAADRDTGLQRGLLRAVESQQDCQTLAEAGPGPRPPSQRKRHGAGGRCVGSVVSSQRFPGAWQPIKY